MTSPVRLSPTPCPLSHSFHHISQAVHLLSFLWRSPKAASFKLRTSITSSNMSFPVVVPLHWFNSQQFPWSQLEAWRLRAGQYQLCHRKGICSPFSISCFCRLVATSHTQSVTVFLVFKNARFLSGIAHFNYAALQKLFLALSPGGFCPCFCHNKTGFNSSLSLKFCFCEHSLPWHQTSFHLFCLLKILLFVQILLFVLVFCFIVSSYAIFFNYGHIGSAHKTKRFTLWC